MATNARTAKPRYHYTPTKNRSDTQRMMCQNCALKYTPDRSPLGGYSSKVYWKALDMQKKGYSLRQIARKLKIKSPQTVANWVKIDRGFNTFLDTFRSNMEEAIKYERFKPGEILGKYENQRTVWTTTYMGGTRYKFTLLIKRKLPSLYEGIFDYLQLPTPPSLISGA
jgi:hypothetical protein